MIPSGRAKRQRSEVGQPVALVVRRNFIRLYGNLPSSKSQRVQNAASMAGISERSGWRLLDMYEGGGSDALVPETPGGANNTLLGNDEIRYLSLLWQSKPGAHVGEYRRQFMMDMFQSLRSGMPSTTRSGWLARRKQKEVFRKFLPANQVKFKHYMEPVVQMQDWQLRSITALASRHSSPSIHCRRADCSIFCTGEWGCVAVVDKGMGGRGT
jgi:hypothetical protein